jgi:hypothetical protein
VARYSDVVLSGALIYLHTKGRGCSCGGVSQVAPPAFPRSSREYGHLYSDIMALTSDCARISSHV